MKKKFLSIAFGMAVLASGVQAQTGPMVMTLPRTCLEYDILHVSSNGKWACGVINNGIFSAWVWNLTTGELTELTPVGISSTAWQISDDGVVAGSFLDPLASGNGAAVESQGYWKSGHWYHLDSEGCDVITNPDFAGTANAISPDGRYIGGQVRIKGEYTPVIWENGVMKVLPNYDCKSKGGAVFSVDNNGYAAGWTYCPSSTGSINRAAALWNPELFLPSPERIGPFSTARMSPNGRYAAAVDRIYDTVEGKSLELDLMSVWSFEICAIADNGVCVGMYQEDMMSRTKGCIIIDGKFKDINLYLKEQGVDLKKYDIAQVFGVSSDCKTFGAMAYDTSVGGDGIIVTPIVVKLDENITTREPAGITALLLEGANAVKLDWRKPLAGAEAVTGYQIFQNDKLIYTADSDVFTYTASNLENGTYSYTAKAVYGDKLSENTEAATIEVKDKELSSPRELMGLQARVNDVRLIWEAPESTLPSLRYYKEDDEVSGMGWNRYSLECGTRFTSDMLGAYGTDAKIEGVTFYPMSSQYGWKVSVYTADNTNDPIYVENVSDSQLQFKVLNSVMFSKPLVIPAGKDLIVAVTAVVNQAGPGSFDVMGRVNGKKRIGYTDLMRRVGVDDDFFSMYELSMSRPENEAEDNTTWPIGALISNAKTEEYQVAGYQIWDGDKKVASTQEKEATIKGVEDGHHTFKVMADYSNGAVSPATETSVDVTANTSVYDIANLKATADVFKVTTSWEAPVNDDATEITYAMGNSSSNGLVGSKEYNYGYTVAAKIYGKMLKPYNGYSIKAFRFYPLSDAYFSFSLKANGKEIVYKDVEESDYVIGKWNTIELDSPIELDPNAEYMLELECFEPTPETAPIGIDGKMSHTGAGDLYKQGDGDFMSLYTESGISGNWMIGMIVGTPESEPLDLLGYNVRIGNSMTGETLLTSEPIAETTYTHTVSDKGNYTFRVSPVYAEPVGERNGMSVTCRVTGESSVEDIVLDGVKLYPNPATEFVKADGDVLSMTAYTLSGAKAAYTNGNMLNVSELPAGVYLVKVLKSDGEFNAKVTVIK